MLIPGATKFVTVTDMGTGMYLDATLVSSPHQPNFAWWSN